MRLHPQLLWYYQYHVKMSLLKRSVADTLFVFAKLSWSRNSELTITSNLYGLLHFFIHKNIL